MSTFLFPIEGLRIIMFWEGSIAIVYHKRLKSLNIKKIYWMIFDTFCSDMIQISTLQNTKCLFIRIAARRERERQGERKKACLSICNTYTTCKQRCILTWSKPICGDGQLILHLSLMPLHPSKVYSHTIELNEFWLNSRQRFPAPVFLIRIPVLRLSSLGTRFRFRFRDCPWLEHDSESRFRDCTRTGFELDSDSGSETAQA